MATRKSDCLSSSGHENTALLLCRAAVWCQRVTPSFPAAAYSPFLPFFLTLFHFPSVLSVLITCCEPGIDHSTTSARLFLPDSSPCSPRYTHCLVKLFIISSARFQSVPFSSQVKSHHPQARVTTSKNAVALFKAGVTTAYFICVCFSHVRNKGGRMHLLIWLHLTCDNFFEMTVICSFMWMQMPHQCQSDMVETSLLEFTPSFRIWRKGDWWVLVPGVWQSWLEKVSSEQQFHKRISPVNATCQRRKYGHIDSTCQRGN